MSDYYGGANLKDWLEEEVFECNSIPDSIVSKFEKWKEGIEAQIVMWWDTDEGDGEVSWRGFGRGFYGIPDDDYEEFEKAVEESKEILRVHAPPLA